MMVAPGARIEVRDAEWLVRRVDKTETKGQALHVVGMSELVKGKEAVFLSDAEARTQDKIKVLDPADTKLVMDESPGFCSSRLYMESLLRKTPPTDTSLYVGHKAAMDVLPFQLEPAAHALEQPRQRILIADAVGLGKTITCGILLSELIRRGKGKRILVVAIKSLLTQFQKEMWSRFTIPLTRLDSVGLQRVRNHIPSNHNPFHYFDRAIISVDTLKQDNEYRVHLENANWDIIVIDEAHNVAERGESASQRAKLARLLAGRSDSLILLSATPHDGRAKSFASLMNMLDPTAIADPDDYGPEDIRGLFIRRFKKDIQSQVAGSFKEREIRKIPVPASLEEEEAFETLGSMTFHKLDRHKGGSRLFRTTLEKALFSSPAACLQTIGNRIRKLEKEHGEDHPDIPALDELYERVAAIAPSAFTKFGKLVEVLTDKKNPLFWNGKESSDRLVIFTERVETLKFLQDHLPKALKLKKNQVATLMGTDSDQDQQRVVEEFGKDSSRVRLLIATDVASEGINFHYLSHRMIHFDIPWSLMVFQQRNGRIDRYGQEFTPQITYLVTQSEDAKIKGDFRILDLLIEKDEEAQKNIGDPSVFMGVFDETREEAITAQAMENGLSPESFEETMDKNREETTKELFAEGFDPMAILLGDENSPGADAKPGVSKASMPSLYTDDFHYVRSALSFASKNGVTSQVDEDLRLITLDAPEDLLYRFKMLPREIRPKDDRFLLTDQADLIQKEIAKARKEEHAWPAVQYLWELHPVLEWLSDKVLTGLGRHEAPVIHLETGLAPNETVYLLSGLIPNRKGQPLIQHWFGISLQKDHNDLGAEDFTFKGARELEEILSATGFGRKEIPNPIKAIDVEPLRKNLKRVVDRSHEVMKAKREAFEKEIGPKLEEHLNKLRELEARHKDRVKRVFGTASAEKRGQKLRDVASTFSEYTTWVEETLETEDAPYIKVVAVFTRE
ncbi:MAG: DEAD/DEAH box helicase [Desulfobacteraceae bacterium]|nr:DEAD/DEAH box helicase [Desulfobacteraceae bacterium]